MEIIRNLKGFINMVSLTKYIDQLQISLQKGSFDTLGVNETRLDEHIMHITDSIVKINGYSIAKQT